MKLFSLLLTALLAAAVAAPSGGRVLAPQRAPRFLRATPEHLGPKSKSTTKLEPEFQYPMNIVGAQVGAAVEMAKASYKVMALWVQVSDSTDHTALVVQAAKKKSEFYLRLDVTQDPRTDYSDYGVVRQGQVGSSFMASKINVVTFNPDQLPKLANPAKYVAVNVPEGTMMKPRKRMNAVTGAMAHFITTHGLYGGGMYNCVGFVRFMIMELGFTFPAGAEARMATLEAGVNKDYPDPATGYIKRPEPKSTGTGTGTGTDTMSTST